MPDPPPTLQLDPGALAPSQSRNPATVLQRHRGYSVRLPVFEGPLDLLLHLIRQHKIEITNIPIAMITDQYLGYLSLMESLDIEIAGDFLVMAATLMEIKSRMLLPAPELPLDAEDVGDPRQELVRRLLEYERFQQVAEQLREMAAERGLTFSRAGAEEYSGAVPLTDLQPRDLVEAILRLQEARDPEKVAQRNAPLRIRRQAVQLDQRIHEVLKRLLAHGGPMPFSALFRQSLRATGREELLVTFLAVLELVRTGTISAWQEGPLTEILLQAERATDDPSGRAS